MEKLWEGSRPVAGHWELGLLIGSRFLSDPGDKYLAVPCHHTRLTHGHPLGLLGALAHVRGKRKKRWGERSRPLLGATPTEERSQIPLAHAGRRSAASCETQSVTALLAERSAPACQAFLGAPETGMLLRGVAEEWKGSSF